MKVSLVIPVYNVERYIEKCARSLFSQTYEDIEIVFVNDCTPDHSVEIIEKVLTEYPEMQEKVTILHNEKNVGCAASRRRGLDHVSGEYLIQLDSDDYVAPDYVKLMAESAIANDSDMVICDYCHVFDDGHQVEFRVNPPADAKECLNAFMSGMVHNGLWNKMMRRSVLVEHDIYPLNHVRMLEDKPITTRVCYFSKKISYVNKILYYYYKQNPNSISLDNKSVFAEDFKNIISFFDEFFSDKNIDSGLRKSYNYFKLNAISNLLLYAGKEYKEYMDSLLKPISVAEICSQPVIPMHYKLSVLAYKLNIPFSYHIVRQVIKTMRAIMLPR